MKDYRCSHCKKLVNEAELVIISDDPSPNGISLPSGAYSYAYCPHCGEEIGDGDEFVLIDNLDFEERADGSVEVTFEGRGVVFWIDENGDLQWEDRNPPSDKAGKRGESHDAA